MNLSTMFGRVNHRVVNSPSGVGSFIVPNPNIKEPNVPSMLNRGFMPMKYKVADSPVNTVSPPSMNMSNTDLVKPTGTMKWGKPTWFLFHTLAEKVKDDVFPLIRKSLLEIIYSICCNLPCPDCANHAKVYLDGINFNTIQTKEDLKNMLFVFHNTVNKKKGFPIFTREELDSQYSMAITVNIINNFFVYYLIKNNVPKMIAQDMFRRRIIQNAKDWLNKNMTNFAP